jgi:hypothetical protein
MLRRKLPTVINLDRRIPDLFSFGFALITIDLLRHAQEYLERHISFLNRLAQNQSIEIYPHQLKAMRIEFLAGIQICQLRFPQDRQAQKLQAQLRLACYLIESKYNSNLFVIPPLSVPMQDIVDIYEFFLELANKDDELWWYCAFSLYLSRDHLTPEDNSMLIDLLADCAEGIVSLHYKEAIETLILKLAKANQGEFSAELTQRLQTLFNPPLFNYSIFAVHSRKRRMTDELRNKRYFDYETPFTANTTPNKFSRINLGESTGIHELELNERNLRKYAGHIYPPSPPILLLNVPYFSKEENETYNTRIRRRLRASKLCNSEGFLDDDFCKPTNRVLICHIYAEEMNKMRPFTSKVDRDIFERQLFDLNIKPQFDQMQAMRKSLEGFGACDALHLSYRCLAERVAPFPNMEPVITIVQNALKIKYLAEKIHFLKEADHEKHKRWFALAGKVIELLQKGKSAIVYTGVPIDEDDKMAGHAIYVGFKQCPCGLIRVIVTNGGDRVRMFHQPAEHWVKKDREEYYYAALAPFALNANNQEALQHYIYKLLCIPYLPSTNKDDTDEQGNIIPWGEYTYNGLVRNIYLRPTKPDGQEYFLGLGSKRFTCFRREDLAESFLVQFMGNCTIHNLKKSLQIMFDMDMIQFEELERNLVLGLDNIMTRYHTSAEQYI